VNDASEQISAFSALALERSDRGARLRRRIGAVGAMSLVLCGFLVAIGLGVVVLTLLAAALTAASALALVAVLPRTRQRLGPLVTTSRSNGRRAVHVLAPQGRDAWSASLAAFASARHSASSTGRRIARATRTAVMRFAPRATATELRRQALRLNETGSEHRRNGLYDKAAECHRQALEILRALDDRRAIALTENNLALALSRAGDDHWAIGLFEEAAATLRELGDEEHEAQIMANLGLAHRRHGRREEGDTVLQVALAKLSPASSAYQAIESELLRAS
jgi:tetratricopeptide (TPR) repeat protein